MTDKPTAIPMVAPLESPPLVSLDTVAAEADVCEIVLETVVFEVAVADEVVVVDVDDLVVDDTARIEPSPVALVLRIILELAEAVGIVMLKKAELC